MRVDAKSALLLVFYAVAPLSWSAEHRPRNAGSDPLPAKVVHSSYRTPIEPALLNAEEGLAVIGAALESRGHANARMDCSHLVQAVYERAGFPYSYVNSTDLYHGIEEFDRVTRAQSGDLVVWPGHVGIVISPSQKTFFSSLTSGTGLEAYDSPYWKRRGTPRFYRYVTARYVAARATANRDTIGRETTDGETIDQKTSGKKVSSQATPSLQRAALAARDMVNPLPSETVPSELSQQRATTLAPMRAKIVESSKPKPDQISEALRSALENANGSLRDADIFTLTRSLLVVDELEARAVKIHGDQGEATIRITTMLSVDGTEVNLEKQQQIERWTLKRRDRKSWEILFPEDAVYVRRDVAVRALAHQLARLSDADDSSTNLRQKSQLAQMLNAILANSTLVGQK
jgi:NlpC/P60 family